MRQQVAPGVWNDRGPARAVKHNYAWERSQSLIYLTAYRPHNERDDFRPGTQPDNMGRVPLR